MATRQVSTHVFVDPDPTRSVRLLALLATGLERHLAAAVDSAGDSRVYADVQCGNAEAVQW